MKPRWISRAEVMAASCLLSWLVGCGQQPHFGGAGDFHYAVAGNYEVWCSSAAEVRISPRIFDDSTPIIPSRVTEVAWDDRFVVARQDIKVNHDNSKHEFRGVVNSPTQSQYWILDVSGPRIHGPYGLMQLEGERRRLGVPDALVLRPVNSYLSHHSTSQMKR